MNKLLHEFMCCVVDTASTSNDDSLLRYAWSFNFVSRSNGIAVIIRTSSTLVLSLVV